MQNFTDIPSTRTLSDSLAEILNNDKTAISCSSGTAFPTANLQLGMLCFRTDQNKLYILKATSPSSVWVEIMDVTASSGKAPNAEAVDGIDGSAVLLKASNLSDLANTATARTNLGIGNVENKSSATIRSEITSGNVTGALGYTPLNKAGDSMTGALTLPNLGIGTTSDASNTNRTITYQNSAKSWYAGLRGDTGNSWTVADDVAHRLAIDSNGRVTMPYQPTFSARSLSGSLTLTGTPQRIVFNSMHSNVGSHYSAGVFTAPVAGVYFFSAFALVLAGGNAFFDLRKNGLAEAGGRAKTEAGSGAVEGFIGVSAHLHLAVGDQVEIVAYRDGSAGVIYEAFNCFLGRLVG